MAYELIETIEVGAGGAASIEFTSIPQDGVDLQILLSGRSSGGNASLNVSLNSDTTDANYDRKVLFGTGSSVGNLSGNFRPFLYIVTSTATANTFGNSSVYISNYAGATNKSMSVDIVQENNATASNQAITANLWNNTAAVTSVTLSGSLDVAQYSTASLYKITAD